MRDKRSSICIIQSIFRVSGTHLSAELSGEQLADMKAYLNLTEMVLSNAELYITWAGMRIGVTLTPGCEQPFSASVYEWGFEEGLRKTLIGSWRRIKILIRSGGTFQGLYGRES